MQKGFTQVSLGLIGAALLSSSAFAAPPTVDGLPTVIIREKTRQDTLPIVLDEGDGAPASDIYRYTAAFSLALYVTNDANDDTSTSPTELADVRWLFTEHDETGATMRTGGAQTISINSTLGEDTVPTWSDITTSGQLAVDGSEGVDFVNVELTPDVTTDGTPPSGGEDAALLTLYIGATADGGQNVASDAFMVYTTNLDSATYESLGDLITGPTESTESTTIYTPGYCSDDLSPWFVQMITGPGTAVPGTTTPVPSVALASDYNAILGTAGVDVTPSPTASLTEETDGTPSDATSVNEAFQYVSWQSFRRDLAGIPKVSIPDDDTLMMVRWTLSADAATQAAAATDLRTTAAECPIVRLRAGESGLFGNGQAIDLFAYNGTNSITEADRIVRTYYYAKRGGNYDAPYQALEDFGGVQNAPVEAGFFFDILDEYTDNTAGNAGYLATSYHGNRDYGLTLSKIEAFLAPVSGLTGETVVFNQGGAVTPAAGESAPPSTGLAQFNLEWWDAREAEAGTGDRIDMTPAEFEVVGGSDTLNITINANSSGDFGARWDASDYASPFGNDAINPYAGGDRDDLITVNNDDLVRLSAWITTNVAVGTDLPGVQNYAQAGTSFARMAYFADFYGETGDGDFSAGTSDWVQQGRSGYVEFAMVNSVIAQVDIAEALEPVYGLEPTNSVRVDYFFEPNLASGSTLSFRPAVSVFGFPGAANDVIDEIAATITYNRIVVTTYDRPGEPAPDCP